MSAELEVFLGPRLLTCYPTPTLAPSEFGWCMPENQEAFRNLLSPSTKLILEVGSYHGLSARLMLKAAPNASIVCVDTWQDHPAYGHYRQFEIFTASCWALRDRVYAVRGSSAVILPQLLELGLRPDIIYVDGDHTSPVAGMDIENALKFPGAVVFGDDFAEEFPDVVSALNAARLRHDERKFTFNGRCWSLGRNPS